MKILIFICLFISMQTFASSNILVCKIIESKGTTDNGLHQETGFSKLYINKAFTLNKESGEMNGGLSNHNSFGKPQILDHGNSEQNYKAITVYEPYVKVDLIQVSFAKNKNNQYSFLFVSGTQTFSGLCSKLNE